MTHAFEPKARRNLVDLVWSGLSRALGSLWATGIILCLVAIQGLLIAWSARALVIDEEYHLGIIRLYSAQLSPRLLNSPDTQEFGDVQHSGSFLYHWLASFPYRWLVGAGVGDATVLALIRTGSTAMVTGGLAVWHRTFVRLGARPAVANVALLLVMSIPVTILVSAAVNYDAALFLLTALTLHYAVRIVVRPSIRLSEVGWYVMWTALACITKYTALPMAFVVTVAIVGALVFKARRRPRDMPLLDRPQWYDILPLAFAVAAIIAFASRYVPNMLAYGTPVPDCGIVESTSYCSGWGPWRRNHQLGLEHPADASTFGGLVNYGLLDWVPNMVRTLSVIGVRSSEGIAFAVPPPLTLALLTWAIYAAVGLTVVAAIVLFRNGRWILAAASATTAVTLFGLNYTEFLRYGVAELAVNGRYLLPLAPFLALAVTEAVARSSHGLHQVRVAGLRIVMLVALLLAMTQGGGAITYLYSLDETWIADGSPIRGLTLRAHHVVEGLILEPLDSP